MAADPLSVPISFPHGRLELGETFLWMERIVRVTKGGLVYSKSFSTHSSGVTLLRSLELRLSGSTHSFNLVNF